ncbi:DUF3885 domain-containing protein [Pseudomonas sp. NPDC089534]|uniref:DUF3885 domain-containing protein n=1 Tax=Pseudomonas sp. NPDC089534 TaxID=3364468 RepID=UPI00381DA522
MNLQIEIDHLFDGQAFARPLFYACPGGLRFGLSEGGGMIEQFLTALRKATEVCRDVFDGEDSLTVCLRTHSRGNPMVHRATLRALQSAGIQIPAVRSVWSEMIDDEWFDETVPEYWVNVAFEAPSDLLQAVLWCAMASDFGAIRPKPGCAFYLFNLNRQVMAFPYDDRGMDVVGPNKTLLSQLYRKHQAYLLDYDRDEMDATFAESGDD